MIKSLPFIFLLFLALSLELHSQDCSPDTSLPSGVLGVFPMPLDPEINPMGGIRDTACEGAYFEFTFTTITGDSFSLGENRLALDSLSLLSEEEGVKGLPNGIAYNCEPGTCAFPKNSQGCVKLSGTPEEEGVFPLTLNGLLFANGASFGLNLSFPNPLIAPGKYNLVVLSENDTRCKAASISQNQIDFIETPSSFTNEIILRNTSQVRAVTLYNLNGQVAKREKAESLKGLGHLPKGIYLLSIELENGSHRFKKVFKQ